MTSRVAMIGDEKYVNLEDLKSALAEDSELLRECCVIFRYSLENGGDPWQAVADCIANFLAVQAGDLPGMRQKEKEGNAETN